MSTQTIKKIKKEDQPPITLGHMEKLIVEMVDNRCMEEADIAMFEDADITYGREVGRGRSGVIYECTVLYEGIQVKAAAKRYYCNGEDAVKDVLGSVKLQVLCFNPMVPTTLRVLGISVAPEPYMPLNSSASQRIRRPNDGPQIVVITELGVCNLLELYQREQVPMYVTLDLYSRLSASVSVMHKNKIVHRDIKLKNIVVLQIIFRFVDMGITLSEFLDDIVSSNGEVGTSGYHAPEILTQQAYNYKSDVFMLGVTFCLLAQAPKMLKSNGGDRLLRYMHEIKVCKRFGRSLYESTVERELMQWNYNQVPPLIKDTICEMLEIKELRRVSLTHISQICASQSDIMLSTEKCKRLVGVKPIVTNPELNRQTMINEAVENRDLDIAALRALSNIERTANHGRNIVNAKRARSSVVGEDDSEVNSLFNPGECRRLADCMRAASCNVGCIANSAFQNEENLSFTPARVDRTYPTDITDVAVYQHDSQDLQTTKRRRLASATAISSSHPDDQQALIPYRDLATMESDMLLSVQDSVIAAPKSPVKRQKAKKSPMKSPKKKAGGKKGGRK